MMMMMMIMIIMIVMGMKNVLIMMMPSTGDGWSGRVTRLSIVSSKRNTEVTMIEGNQVRNIGTLIL